MALMESPTQTMTPSSLSTNDEKAIADLRVAFDAQRTAFNVDRNPSLEERKTRLGKLIGMLLAYRERIAAAMDQDFSGHPAPMSDLLEVMGPIARAQYVIEKLEEWMRPASRETNPMMTGNGQAFIQSQAKGVIGNIVPWNFPFDLSVGPLVEMLAAGNRVIIKPSEFTPACADLLREMVKNTFDPTLVYVAVGGLELARAFADLPWNHLLYTGSANVGRQIMQAAARNLTPVTLELGGKCPAILTQGSVDATNVRSILGTKALKNGQMCVSVDYCLVPRADVDVFVKHANEYMQQIGTDHSQGVDGTGIISLRHMDRIAEMLQEARDHRCVVVDLEPGGKIDRAKRRMPLSLVVDPTPDLRVMTEEIFGPILPIVPYDDIDKAIAFINAGERPLGLYVFGTDKPGIDHILSQTISGGAAVNTCAFQAALPSLAFGGVGMSGMGRHHGHEGFKEFSNPRGVMVRGEGDLLDAFYPPYATAAQIVKGMLG